MRKRLSNLWKLSAFEPSTPNEEKDGYPVGTKVSMVVQKPSVPEKPIQMATIIKVREKDPIDELVGELNIEN